MNGFFLNSTSKCSKFHFAHLDILPSSIGSMIFVCSQNQYCSFEFSMLLNYIWTKAINIWIFVFLTGIIIMQLITSDASFSSNDFLKKSNICSVQLYSAMLFMSSTYSKYANGRLLPLFDRKRDTRIFRTKTLHMSRTFSLVSFFTFYVF